MSESAVRLEAGVRNAVVRGIGILKAAFPYAKSEDLSEPTVQLYCRAFAERSATAGDIEQAFYRTVVRTHPPCRFWPSPSEVLEQYDQTTATRPFLPDPVLIVEDGEYRLADRERARERGLVFFEQEPRLLTKSDAKIDDARARAMPELPVVTEAERDAWLADQKRKLAASGDLSEKGS